MGKIKTIVSASLGVICVTITFFAWERYREATKDSVVVKHDLTLMSNLSDIYSYEYISDNEIKCDVGTLSNIVINMTNSGFSMENVKYLEDGEIDILLKNNEQPEEVYRLYYGSNRVLTVICSSYEKSSSPFTYINK